MIPCYIVASLVDGRVREVWLRGPAAPWTTARARGEYDAARDVVTGETLGQALASAAAVAAARFAGLAHLFDADLRDRIDHGRTASANAEDDYGGGDDDDRDWPTWREDGGGL